MKTRILIFILALSALAAAFYYLTAKRLSRPPSEVATQVPSDAVLLPQGEIQPNSFLQSLNDRVFLALAIQPERLSPAVERWESFLNKLSTTALWQKLNLSQILEESSVSKQTASSLPLDVLSKSTPEAFSAVKAWYGALEEIGVALAKEDRQANEGGHVFGLYLKATFRNPDMLSELANQLDAALLNPAQSNLPKFLTVTKRMSHFAPRVYDLLLALKENMPVKGVLQFEDRRINLLLGLEEKPTLADDASRPPLSAVSEWSNIKQAVVANAAVVAGVRVKEIAPALESLVKYALSEEEQNLAKEAVARSLSDFRSAGFSLSVEDGLVLRRCLALNAGSKAFKRLQSFFQSRASLSSASFYKLIGSQTVFAVRLSESSLMPALESLRDSYDFSDSVSGEHLAAWKKFEEQLSKLSAILGQAPIQELGLLVDLAPAAFWPEIGLFLGTAGDASLTELSGIFNRIIDVLTSYGSAAHLPRAKLSRDKKNEEQIEVQLNDGGRIIARKPAENVVIASMSPALIEAAKSRLQDPKPFLTVLLAKRPEMESKIVSSAQYFYLSTQALIPVAKMLASLLSARQGPGGIAAAELDEGLNLLDFKILATEQMYQTAPDCVCSQGQMNIF